MKLFKQLGDGFSALRLRDRVIAVAAVASGLALGGNLLLLKPQSLEINRLHASKSAHQTELATFRKVLVEINREKDNGIDPVAKEKVELAELKRRIAEVGAFIGQTDSSTSQVGVLVRSLIRDNPGLTLVSLRTRPGAVFYTPPAPPKETVSGEIGKALAQIKKDEDKDKAPPVVLVNKIIYKHGVEVNVKGAYPALMSYLKEMQKLPQRIFWSEATLDANNHLEATLRLLIHTLSDKSDPPLN